MTSVDAASLAAAHAYDALAPVYDAHLTGDMWMRRALWARYDACFAPGDRVLDLGCGTGTDLVHLAARGVQVSGIDVSSRMIDRARAKLDDAGLALRAELHVGDLRSLGDLGQAQFDGIISSFAGLNTMESMGSLAADASRLLVPGGRMIVHVLNPRCLRAWLASVARGRWAAARDMGREGARTFLLDGNAVPHYLYRGETLYARDFAPYFHLERMYALGIVRGPAAHATGVWSWDAPLARIDAHLGARGPLRHWGRFVVLEMLNRTPRGPLAVTSRRMRL